MAISGLHMTFLGMGIYNLLRRAGLGFVPSGITGAALLILYSMMIYVLCENRGGDHRTGL